MKVVRAKTAGFCMGVGLALQKLDRAIAEGGAKGYARICTLGPLIHNPQVLDEYAAKGVACIEDDTDVAPGDCVVIRAHGIPRQLEEGLRKSGVLVVDATCPKVKKAQLAIARATEGGAPLILFGEADHPEVRGLVSYANGERFVIGSPADLDGLSIGGGRAPVLASQTTQDRTVFARIRAAAEARYPGVVVLSTICDATRERQEEARAIAKTVDVMVIVGGRQSGNTRRLADVAASCGIDTLLVETAEELPEDIFSEKRCAGLTAGASTPKRLIDAAEARLAGMPGSPIS